ncbi:MAG: tetratricopeptide repeat protein, partial [Chloroflexi bacterium]|nr:tetratricopeptide repeat protein [Chloroflexota bacterium]
MEELKLLVFDLNLDWDELHGWGKTARVQDLIVRLGQKGQLDELIALLHTQRSHIAWSDPPPKGRQRADVGDSFSAFDTLKILLSGSPNASVTYSRINTEGGDVVNRDKYVIDTAHIDILQPPQPFYQRRAFWGVIFAFLAVTTLLVATGLGKEIANALAPLPFAREAEGETLIVIATFDRTEGVTDTNIHGELHQAIVDELEGLGVGNVRVEIEPTVLKAGDKERAESLGQQYNASIIIWGADTGVRLTVDFLNLKEPDFDAARVTLHETMRTQLANPEAYAQFVVRDLPNQISFLSLFAVGQSFYVQQNYTQAIPILERGVDLVPLGSVLGEDFELENAYFLLGWLYGTTEQYKQAIANYDRTLELNPQAAAAFNNRGGAYYYLGEYEQAFADYGRALELNPQFAEAFGNRGVAYADLGGYEQAFADYGRALEINPQFAEAFNNRGNAYSDLGEYKQALADYGRALELNP